MSESQFARTPDPRLARQVQPGIRGAATPFSRTVSAEITRTAQAQQQQQYGYPPPRRRTPAEEAALSTLLRTRQRTPAPRQEPWLRQAPEPIATAAPRGDVTELLAARLVPSALWTIVEPLIPPVKIRRQGGGRSRVSDRAIFTAIVFVLTSGCAWRHLPSSFGVTVPTVHRRFQEWTDSGLWLRLRRAAMERHAAGEDNEWTHAVLAAAERRGTKAGV
jgi:transposase